MEIPGLFRGRGAHPKAGKIKKRIMPEDVTLNLGEKAPVPPCPLPGHKWGEIVHNHAVQWLAMFHDPISNHNKYVWFASSSSLKGKSDFKKFETARKLKDHIEKIRSDYRQSMRSASEKEWQLVRACPRHRVRRLLTAGAGDCHCDHRPAGAACGQREGQQGGGRHGGLLLAAGRAHCAGGAQHRAL
jgi:hypothetical protein